MNAETDYDLTPDQWEALKALRTPAAKRDLNRFAVEPLIALRLAAKGWRWPGDHTRRTQRAACGLARLWDVGPDANSRGRPPRIAAAASTFQNRREKITYNVPDSRIAAGSVQPPRPQQIADGGHLHPEPLPPSFRDAGRQHMRGRDRKTNTSAAPIVARRPVSADAPGIGQCVLRSFRRTVMTMRFHPIMVPEAERDGTAISPRSG